MAIVKKCIVFICSFILILYKIFYHLADDYAKTHFNPIFHIVVFVGMSLVLALTILVYQNTKINNLEFIILLLLLIVGMYAMFRNYVSVSPYSFTLACYIIISRVMSKRKRYRNIIKHTACFLTLIFAMILPVQSLAHTTTEGNSDQNSLGKNNVTTYISNTLDNNSNDVRLLKGKGVYDDFINEAAQQMDTYVQKSNEETFDQISKYHISTNDMVKDVRECAQKYLDDHYKGIVIGTEDFDRLTSKYLDSDDIGTDDLANTNNDFGKLYL